MTAINRKVVGIDVDGVLADFLKTARLDLNVMYGKPAKDMVQTGWGFDSLGVSKDEEKGFWQYVDHYPNWWTRLDKAPNTYLLSDIVRSHRAIFVTNRKDGTGLPVEAQTRLWLEKHFGLNPRDFSVVLSNNKGPVAVGLHFDYFIDDRPLNVESVVTYKPECKSFLMDCTYNQEATGLARIANFDEFAKLIMKESE